MSLVYFGENFGCCDRESCPRCSIPAGSDLACVLHPCGGVWTLTGVEELMALSVE